MKRFWWVRHGPTHQKSFVGWRDVPADLSDTAALRRLSDALPPNAALISSDLSRSVHTADAIAGKRHRLPHDPGLREFNFGDWDGLHHSVVTTQHPELSRTYWETPGDISPPNGESWNTASDRIETAVQALLERSFDDIIVVAHFGAILTQVHRANGLTAYETLAQPIDNLSVTQITIDKGHRTLGPVNIVH